MKRFAWISLVSMAVSWTYAQTPVSGVGQSAVTISFNTAVVQSNEAQKNLAELQKKFAPREAHINALNNEVDGLKRQLSETGDKLADAERGSRIQALDSKEKQLQREIEDYKNDSQTEVQQIFQTVAQKMYAFLQEYAQQHGYRFVLEHGAAEHPIVWYAAENTDITTAVVQAYNAKSGIAAPTTPVVPAYKSN